MENFDVFSCLLLLHSSARIYTSRANTRAKRTEKQKNGRLLPGRPFRRPHLRVWDRKRHFYRRGVAVFVLPFTVRLFLFLSLKADDM